MEVKEKLFALLMLQQIKQERLPLDLFYRHLRMARAYLHGANLASEPIGLAQLAH